MATEFKLPELGEGVDSADVARIYVSEGDQVEPDQNIMELETEKAVADLPCPHSGKVTKIHVSEGDTVEVGQTLLTLEEVEAEETAKEDDQHPQKGQEEAGKQDREAAAEKEQKEEPKAEVTDKKEKAKGDTAEDEEKSDREQSKVATAKDEGADEEVGKGEGTSRPERRDNGAEQLPPAAGPATRRLARKLGVDLDQFQPSERERIRQEDVVRAYVESGKAAMVTSPSLPDFTQYGPIEREPLNKIAQTAAKRLIGSWRSIPHVTQHGLADITELEAARRKHAEQADAAAPKITLTSIAVKSVAGLLREFPKFNSSLDTDNDELILKKHYHIGVAVDTKQGLLVPVIRNVDSKSIEQIATELSDLAGKARRRQLGREEFEGGTFTISNQGGIGGGEFTPIVSYPEVAILGMARARLELKLHHGQPVERLILPLSLSYDHRVINGADAARFVDRLAEILSDAFALLIAT